MKRVAIAGFQHETNTFATTLTRIFDFEKPDHWPGPVFGSKLISELLGKNTPITGLIEAASHFDFELIPLLWCQAPPGGKVEQAAFDRITGSLCSEIEAASPIDAIYLDLHGAMVAEREEDAEGKLLSSIRDIVGWEVPIIASLDNHANVTKRMFENADLLTAYRTYPHVDMKETGSRAARLLAQLFKDPDTYKHKTLKKFLFLIPLVTQSTLEEPSKGIYQLLRMLESDKEVSLSFTMGFPPADIEECGPAVFGYGKEPEHIQNAIKELEKSIMNGNFKVKIWPFEKAIQHYLKSFPQLEKPMLFADTQDNPGAGGTGDSVELLRTIKAHNLDKVFMGLFYDPHIVKLACLAGEGNLIESALGENSPIPGHKSLIAQFKIVAISDGNIEGMGALLKGIPLKLGKLVLLQLQGILILVSEERLQGADIGLSYHFGLKVNDFKLICLKSSVHFKLDFEPLCDSYLFVEGPGFNISDPAKLFYLNYKFHQKK